MTSLDNIVSFPSGRPEGSRVVVEGHDRHTALGQVVQPDASGRTDGVRLGRQATSLAGAGIKPRTRELKLSAALIGSFYAIVLARKLAKQSNLQPDSE